MSEPKTKTEFIVVGPYVWGRGKTAESARSFCYRAFHNDSYPAAFRTHRVHPDTEVTGMGGLEYPADHKPEQIDQWIRWSRRKTERFPDEASLSAAIDQYNKEKQK